MTKQRLSMGTAVKVPTTGTPIKHIETTQDEIISRGVETHKDDFCMLGKDLEEAGPVIAGELDNLVTGVKMPLSEIKSLRIRMSSLAADLDGAVDELTVIIKEAAAQSPAELVCMACPAIAEYMAPRRDAAGVITWLPVCVDHARGWWEGADRVGKMFKIGKGVVEPQETPGRLVP